MGTVPRVVSTRIRRRAWGPSLVDGAVVVLVAALLVAGALVASDNPGETLTWGGAALLVGSAVVLWWRRRQPVAVALASGVCSAIYGVARLPDPAFPVAVIVSLYSVARYCTRRVTMVVAVIAAPAMLIGLVLVSDSGLDDYYRNVIPAVAALIIGDQVRERIRGEDRRRCQALDAAVRSERGRVARELHDVVAHHVSMTVIQAEAAAAACEGQGDAAGTARLDEISASGRGALAELRLLLDVLRDGELSAPVAPQPGLGDVGALVDRVRVAGLPVELDQSGTPVPVPAGTELSAYRIVQEALTNVLRHAGPVCTQVHLGWTDGGLVVEIIDDGPFVTEPGHSGRGLIGLRERVDLLGGQLRVGPRPGGGFAVAATIPIPPMDP